MDHPMANTGFQPSGVPSSSPRIVLMRSVEVDLRLFPASAVNGLGRLDCRHRYDRIDTVCGDDLDGADLQVDGEVDRGQVIVVSIRWR